MIRKKPSITGEKQKMGEISRSKRKGKVVELEGSVLERVKALQVPTRSCLGDASGWATVDLRGCLGCRIGVGFLGLCDIIGGFGCKAYGLSSHAGGLESEGKL